MFIQSDQGSCCVYTGCVWPIPVYMYAFSLLCKFFLYMWQTVFAMRLNLHVSLWPPMYIYMYICTWCTPQYSRHIQIRWLCCSTYTVSWWTARTKRLLSMYILFCQVIAHVSRACLVIHRRKCRHPVHTKRGATIGKNVCYYGVSIVCSLRLLLELEEQVHVQWIWLSYVAEVWTHLSIVRTFAQMLKSAKILQCEYCCKF